MTNKEKYADEMYEVLDYVNSFLDMEAKGLQPVYFHITKAKRIRNLLDRIKESE